MNFLLICLQILHETSNISTIKDMILFLEQRSLLESTQSSHKFFQDNKTLSKNGTQSRSNSKQSASLHGCNYFKECILSTEMLTLLRRAYDLLLYAVFWHVSSRKVQFRQRIVYLSQLFQS